MSRNKNEHGEFFLSIRYMQDSDGVFDYSTGSENQGVPTELVLMQLRAYIKNMEREYFKDFDSKVSKFKQE